MPRKWTHQECFEHFGVLPRNLRWSWSGRSADGKVVAVTFWQDKFEEKGAIYKSTAHSADKKWVGSPGHKELVENLNWTRDHCGGELRIIIAIAKDEQAEPRSIKECFPSKMRMRLIRFDEASGEFVAERIV